MNKDQVGAICVRRADDGRSRVLLVTSRDTGRWVIPKGWIGKRYKPRQAAAREAREEAGVLGHIIDRPIGRFKYLKQLQKGEKALQVSVYLLIVHEELQEWPEQEQRRRVWFAREAAARRVAEPELRAIIRGLPDEFEPAWLKSLVIPPSTKSRRKSTT